MNKHVPNIISILRIILSLVLLLVIDTKLIFFVLVFIIGITDVADGAIARKYNLTSKTGALLDSFADLVFFMIILIILFLRYDSVIMDNLFFFTSVVTVKIITMLVSKIKHGEVVFIHTLANKLTGLLVFILIMMLPFELNKILIKAVLMLSIYAALEEMIIIIRDKEINLNRKSIWRK